MIHKEEFDEVEAERMVFWEALMDIKQLAFHYYGSPGFEKVKAVVDAALAKKTTK